MFWQCGLRIWTPCFWLRPLPRTRAWSVRLAPGARPCGRQRHRVGRSIFSDPLADSAGDSASFGAGFAVGHDAAQNPGPVPRLAQSVRAPIILFSYFNPILQYGLENFAASAARAGVDGALVVDLSPEEAENYVQAMRAQNLDTVFLASPTSTDARLERAAQLSTGFFYLISRTGVTGERSDMASSGRPLAERARRLTSLPLAIGFGISTAAQVREVQSYADAAVVGSAVVHAIEERFAQEGPAAIEEFVRGLKPGRRINPHERYGGLA